MVRAAASRLLAVGTGEARRQLSARATRLRTRNAPGHVGVVAQRVPVTARVDPLLRLDAREAIEYRPSLTTGGVRQAIFSPAFDRVGADFDEIAYGGRPAGEADEAASRDGWQRVLSEVA